MMSELIPIEKVARRETDLRNEASLHIQVQFELNVDFLAAPGNVALL
jgi:hypothetical protein